MGKQTRIKILALMLISSTVVQVARWWVAAGPHPDPLTSPVFPEPRDSECWLLMAHNCSHIRILSLEITTPLGQGWSGLPQTWLPNTRMQKVMLFSQSDPALHSSPGPQSSWGVGRKQTPLRLHLCLTPSPFLTFLSFFWEHSCNELCAQESQSQFCSLGLCFLICKMKRAHHC